MECANSAECVPFFVAIEGAERPEDIGIMGWDMEPLHGSQTAAGSLVVHAGSAANLVLEGPHMHMQLPVICLESGRAGETIRVTSKDHRQTFSAEIVGRNELKGILQ